METKLPLWRQVRARILLPVFRLNRLQRFVLLEPQSDRGHAIRSQLTACKNRASLPTATCIATSVSKVEKKAVFFAVIFSIVALSISITEANVLTQKQQPQRLATAHPITGFIDEASQRFGIPTRWIHAVIGIESASNLQAVSPKGAMGLMQIMPKTYAELRARYHLGTNPYDPRDNILAGTAYLREMHDLYGSPGFLAAYNAGPLRYEDYLMTGRPLPAETRAYVATLAATLGLRQDRDFTKTAHFNDRDQKSASRGPLFVEQLERVFASVQTAFSVPPEHNGVRAPVTDLSALEPSSRGLSVAKPSAASLFASRSFLTSNGAAKMTNTRAPGSSSIDPKR